jgi:hypothetical protein
MLGWDSHALQIDGVAVSFEETGTTLTLDEVFVSHQDDDGGALRLQGVEIVLAPGGLRAPVAAVPLACRYIDQIVSVRIDGARVVPGSLAGFGHQVIEARGLEVRPDPATRCLDLEILAGSLIGTRDSGFSWSLSELRLKTDLPETREAAETGQTLSRVTFSAGRSTFQFPDTARYAILNGASLDLQLVSLDLVPAFMSFDPRLALAPSWRETSALMDLWNIAMLSQGRMDIAVDSAQILATRIVPTYLTANFRNAGLSAIPGVIDARIDLNRGQVDFTSSLGFAGLADIAISSRFRGLLFGRDVLGLADRSRITLSDVPPDLAIEEFRMTWLDRGFQSRFTDLLGLLPGTWFEMFSEQDGIRFSESFKARVAGYPPVASRFFRAASPGREVVITSRATDAPRLGQVLSAATGGPAAVLQIFPLGYE